MTNDIGGVNALVFTFALSLVGLGAGVAIVVAIVTGYWFLWFIAIVLLGLGVWALYEGIRKHG
jgi:cadmium resistance protein CadD (predicted permease)